MSNMSYCQFENTLEDLKQCLETLDIDEDLENLSDSERKHAKKLIGVCGEIWGDFNHLIHKIH